MRVDKLTTAFQQALAEAQSLAVARDNPYIEPAHVLAAMLVQADGPKALLARAGVNVGQLQSGLEDAMKRLPQVQGGEQVQPGRELGALLQAAEKEATSAATSSSRASCSSSLRRSRRRRSARSSRSSAPTASRSRRRSRRSAAARRSTAPTPRVSARR